MQIRRFVLICMYTYYLLLTNLIEANVIMIYEILFQIIEMTEFHRAMNYHGKTIICGEGYSFFKIHF